MLCTTGKRSGERRPLGCTDGLCCSGPCFLLGDRFSFPDEASFKGAFSDFLSLSLSASSKLVFLSLDLDLLLLAEDLWSTICSSGRVADFLLVDGNPLDFTGDLDL